MSDDKRVVKYVLTQSDLDRIIEIAAEHGAKAYKDERARQEKKDVRENDKGKITKKLLSSYRRLKLKLKDESEFTTEEKIEFRWKFMEDLMGTPNQTAIMAEREALSREAQRRKDMYDVFRIEQAVELFEKECESVGSPEMDRRCRELRAAYIDEEYISMENIAEKEKVAVRTLYDDLNKACRIVSVYLLGA